MIAARWPRADAFAAMANHNAGLPMQPPLHRAGYYEPRKSEAIDQMLSAYARQGHIGPP
jgi:hypothetical protein